jgi:hypothetical protein
MALTQGIECRTYAVVQALCQPAKKPWPLVGKCRQLSTTLPYPRESQRRQGQMSVRNRA